MKVVAYQHDLKEALESRTPLELLYSWDKVFGQCKVLGDVCKEGSKYN